MSSLGCSASSYKRVSRKTETGQEVGTELSSFHSRIQHKMPKRLDFEKLEGAAVPTHTLNDRKEAITIWILLSPSKARWSCSLADSTARRGGHIKRRKLGDWRKALEGASSRSLLGATVFLPCHLHHRPKSNHAEQTVTSDTLRPTSLSSLDTSGVSLTAMDS